MPLTERIFLNSRSGGVESKSGPLGTSATSGLLYLPRVIVRMENSVEWRFAGETEVLGENRHFVHHKSHLTRPGREHGSPLWKAVTNRLSYGAAITARLANSPWI
jgi:hypothetical protein